jgi:hypothetical protein
MPYVQELEQKAAQTARLSVELKQVRLQIDVRQPEGQLADLQKQNAALKKELEKANAAPQVEVQILTAQLAKTNAQGAMLESELHKLKAKLAAAEGQLADLQEHFNALLQVLSRRCLYNRDEIVEQEQARASEEIFLNSVDNVQGERAESARLALELQQARQTNIQLADLQQQQIEQAQQQSNTLLQVLSRDYIDDIMASLSLSHALARGPPPPPRPERGEAEGIKGKVSDARELRVRR